MRALLLALALLVATSGQANAALDDKITPPVSRHSGLEVGGTRGSIEALLGGDSIRQIDTRSEPAPPPPPMLGGGITGGCMGDLVACLPDPVVAPGPQITQGIVLRALRRVELPASRIVVQPPGGKTLVNFDTLFRTEAAPFTRTVRLLGHRVQLAITPAAFTWTHGDGTRQVTEDPGRAFAEGVAMSEYVSHRYTDAQVTMRPRVDTTYAARFRVDGGPWREVVGTVTITGQAVALRVVEARPTLVGAY